MTIIHRILR